MRLILFTRTQECIKPVEKVVKKRGNQVSRALLSVCAREVAMCSAAHVDTSTGPGGVCRRQPLRLKRMEVTRRLLK